jgi:hypothetical protein
MAIWLITSSQPPFLLALVGRLLQLTNARPDRFEAFSLHAYGGDRRKDIIKQGERKHEGTKE